MPSNRVEKYLFKKVEIWAVLLAIILFTLFSFFYGVIYHKYKVFPYGIVLEISNFIKGNTYDDRSVVTRLKTETIGLPETKINITTTMSKGYYLIYGTFTMEGETDPLALLIDNSGTIIKTWRFPFFERSRRPQRLQISDNGILVSNAADRLRAQSWCGEEIWSHQKMGFHHEMDYNQGEFTLWMNDKIVKVNEFSGDISEIIDTKSIVLANPDLHSLRATLSDFRYSEAVDNKRMLFDKRQKKIDKKEHIKLFLGDSFHQNKVAVNSAITDKFPEGSLLISLRQLDLVAIISPETGKVLWHEYFDRQHDPDWVENGILVYNNRVHFEYSTIDFINFNGSRKVLVGPENYNWYRRSTGNQQVYNNGSMVFQAEENKAIHINNDQTMLSNIVVSNGKLMNVYFLSSEKIERWNSQCNKVILEH